jgi:hypothetical protein
MSVMVKIDTMRTNPDSARVYKWDVLLSGLGPGTANMINLRCTSLDVPQLQYDVIDVNLRGFTKKESGAASWQDITFTVIEVVSFEILATLWRWGQKQFHNRSGIQQNKSNYEGNVIIQMLNLQDVPIKTWNLVGCVLVNVNVPQLTSEKGGTMDTTFSVAYDYADLL